MAQEQINGFKKVTQSFGGNTLSTEYDGEYIRVTGPNYIECRPSLKVNDMVNGYGGYSSFIGVQPMYTWTHMIDLAAYDEGDDILIYKGDSVVPSLNPFARIFGDDFSSCVIWPMSVEILGNGFDYNNYINVTLSTNGTYWLPDDLTSQIATYTLSSYQTAGGNIYHAFPFKADSAEINFQVDEYLESGTPADADHKFNIVYTLACQKIEI